MVVPENVGEKPTEEALSGLKYVRGAEVVELRDEKGALMNDFTGRVKPSEQVRERPARTSTGVREAPWGGRSIQCYNA